MLKGVLFKKLWSASRKQGSIDYLNTNVGRPRKLNECDERLVLRKVKLNPKLSAPKFASNIADECKKHVNPETNCRIIRRAGYNGQVAGRKPLINDKIAKYAYNSPGSII